MHVLQTLLTDLRVSLRRLRQRPLFVVVATLTLGLGIGLNATIFTFVDALLFRPLPVEDPERLVSIYSSWPEEVYASTSRADLADLSRAGDVVEVFGHSMVFASLQSEGRSEILVGELASGGYFDVLGVPAAHGRTLEPADDVEGAARVVVVSWPFFQSRLDGDQGRLGSTVRLNGESYQVVGVTPPGFEGLSPGLRAEMWLPSIRFLELDEVGQIHAESREASLPLVDRRGYRWMWVKGRLADGVSAEQAEAKLSAIMASLADDYPVTHEGVQVRVLPADTVRIHPEIDEALQAGALVVGLMVGLVLLVACANLASMFLAHALERRRETAVRLALGAGRLGIMRLFATEILLVSVLGGGVALGIAHLTTRALLAHPPPIPFSLDLAFGVDGRIAAFTAILSLVAGLVAAAIPALQASRPDLVPALKESLGASRGGAAKIRRGLVVSQVAVSLVLLVASGLVLRGLSKAEGTDVGFEAEKVAAVGMSLTLHGYDVERSEAFYQRLRTEVAALPGVESVGLAKRPPFSVNLHVQEILPDSKEWLPDDDGLATDVTWVDAGYAEALDLEVLRGRAIDARDVAGAPKVAVLSAEAARRFWPDDDPLGRRFRVGDASGPEFEVVGVVSDYTVRAVGEKPVAMVHFAYHQRPTTDAYVLARTAGPPAPGLAAQIRDAALAIDPELAFAEVTTLEGMAGVTLFPVRAGSVLLSAFAGLGLFLAAVGLYGVVAYAARQRQREMGVRVALGALPRDVIRLLLRDGLGLVLVGAIAGLAAAAFAGQLLSGILYGRSPFDPVAFAGAVLVLAAVALSANLVPALRAARRDPLVALRDE